MYPDYLLNDLIVAVLLLFLLWSVATAWLCLLVWRYITRLHTAIDALHSELEQLYQSQPSQAWMGELAHDLFGEDIK